MISKQETVFLTKETFFEYRESLTEKILSFLFLFPLSSLFSLSYRCVSIEKEKISCLSLIKTNELAAGIAAVLGDDNFIDL
jgi:hypothetical protein